MDDEKPSTRLTDLPTDILQEIISHLDNDGLLQLGRTCKDTHTLALSEFFSQNDLRRPEEGFIVAYKKPIETLPALRAALFVKDLRQLHCYLNPNLDRLIGEVADLRSLAARVSTMEMVWLHFSVVDGVDKRVWSVPARPDGQEDVERACLRGCWMKIRGQSCIQLLVTGGERLKELYLFEPKPVQHPPIRVETRPAPVAEEKNQRSFKKLLRRIFRRARKERDPVVRKVEEPLPKAEEQRLSPAPAPRNRLKELDIHSDILLQEPFLDWTLSRVEAASATLTKLSFKCISVPRETWRTVLRTLVLPHLLEFEVCFDLVVYETCGARFVDVMHFLSQHPSLSIIHLHGVEVLILPDATIKPILPKVTSITAHPVYVTYILQSSRNRLPHLSAVCISTEYLQTPNFDYQSFDTALNCIASFKFMQPIILTLRFQTHYGVEEWFAAHRELGPQSPLASLHQINSLIIACAWHVDLPQSVTASFDEWLALFPSVEKVEFTEQAMNDPKKCFLDPEFLKRLAVACPKLKEVVAERELVNIVSIRDDPT
ncbi:hypothetical protein NLJ89_g4976 [Agrocybe chaxingu]|uniref:F-box domain-containing protein n=1 Tax=Agrocybe chaxingu TaxID=84603 RepID=A0A9W8K253_9AGAR|nr:hypothetical protein NLJ89_g4976 [Agrocybe chaxingu]